MPEKTNSDESEEIVILKGIPAAGERIHKDRLLNDDCNRIVEIILEESYFSKIAAETDFDKNAELHTINQALSNELGFYRNILSANITGIQHDILSYIKDFQLPLKKPPLEQFTPIVFSAQPPPEYVGKEPLLSDAKYSYAGFTVGDGIIAFLAAITVITVSLNLALDMPKSTIKSVSLIFCIFSYIALLLTCLYRKKIDVITRRFNPIAVRAFKADYKVSRTRVIPQLGPKQFLS